MIGVREKKRAWRELTEEEWGRIAPLIPEPQRQGKRKKVTDRQLVDAILCREYTRRPWTQLPGLEDAYVAAMKRYSRWKDNGTLAQIFGELERMGLLPEEEEEAPEGEPEVQTAPPEWWELTDPQWERVAGLLPLEQATRSRRYKTNRQILNIILYREYTNTPWREMPREFGPWRTIYARYAKWEEMGCLDVVFGELRALGIMTNDRYLLGRPPDSEPQVQPEWWELTEEQWQKISPICRSEDSNKRGKKVKGDRQMVNAILCKFRTKTIWVELPEQYGPWRTVIDRYRRWRDDGTLYRIFQALELTDLLAFGKDGAQKGGKGDKDGAGPGGKLEWWELTDGEWASVAELLPPEQPYQGAAYRTNRQILNALLYREYTNTPWREMPEKYGSWRTVFNRCTQWKKEGCLGRTFAALKRAGVIAEDKYRRGRDEEWEEDALFWWELTDEQWRRVRPLLPAEDPNRKGRREKSSRQMLNAILCRYYTNTPWLELPKKYGSWRTIIKRYQQWRDEGLLDSIFGVLNDEI